jgi:hypothetical protein
MNHATRLLLRLFWLFIPVVIAACYGPPVRYAQRPDQTDRDAQNHGGANDLVCVLPDGGTGTGAACAK